MHLDEARELKRQCRQYVMDRLATEGPPPPGLTPPGVALGVVPRRGGEFDLAVRFRDDEPTSEEIASTLGRAVGPTADVRVTGRITALVGAGLQPPEPATHEGGENGRVRPLRPGISIAHQDVTAGTLGGFVTAAENPSVYVLSNYHVLAGSPAARAGDAVLQPGPADGGRLPRDQVGALAAFVPLTAGETAVVDAAVARLENPDIDPTYPVGRLAGWVEVEGDDAVQKVGRTTGVTDGRVSAIELDNVTVGYGPELGQVQFDNQIEVESAGARPFSQGGDSGSVVYRPDDRRAVGLLFAGSETGGQNGTGLTYLNPIEEVLTALGVTLMSSPESTGGAPW